MVSLLVCVGLIAASVSVRNDKNTPPVVQQVGNDVVGITSWVVALPANGISHGLDDVANLFNTYSENERLKSSLDDLAQTKVQNQSLRQENKQLKKRTEVEGHTDGLQHHVSSGNLAFSIRLDKHGGH